MAGWILSIVVLAGCTPTGQLYTVVTVAPWNPVSAPWNSTLWGIARHYHVAGGYRALAELNGVPDPLVIRPGQQIKVPI
jgi:LysM repeat protein